MPTKINKFKYQLYKESICSIKNEVKCADNKQTVDETWHTIKIYNHWSSQTHSTTIPNYPNGNTEQTLA